MSSRNLSNTTTNDILNSIDNGLSSNNYTINITSATINGYDETIETLENRLNDIETFQQNYENGIVLNDVNGDLIDDTTAKGDLFIDKRLYIHNDNDEEFDVYDEITTNTTNIANNVANINNNALNITTNTIDINNHETRITQNETDISNLQTDISDLQTDISTNTTDITSNLSTINNHETRITQNETDISDLQTNKQDNITSSSDISVSSISTDSISTNVINPKSGTVIDVNASNFNLISDDGTEYLTLSSIDNYWNRIISYSDQNNKNLRIGTTSDTGTRNNRIEFEIEETDICYITNSGINLLNNELTNVTMGSDLNMQSNDIIFDGVNQSHITFKISGVTKNYLSQFHSQLSFRDSNDNALLNLPTDLTTSNIASRITHDFDAGLNTDEINDNGSGNITFNSDVVFNNNIDFNNSDITNVNNVYTNTLRADDIHSQSPSSDITFNSEVVFVENATFNQDIIFNNITASNITGTNIDTNTINTTYLINDHQIYTQVSTTQEFRIDVTFEKNFSVETITFICFDGSYTGYNTFGNFDRSNWRLSYGIDSSLSIKTDGSPPSLPNFLGSWAVSVPLPNIFRMVAYYQGTTITVPNELHLFWSQQVKYSPNNPITDISFVF
jgi:hypothetical protein